MSPVNFSYLVVATGLDTTDGAPLPGSAWEGRATFRMLSDGWAVLPDLRSWIVEHGGQVADETGTPAPARTLDDSGLYAVSLGPSEHIAVHGVQRVSAACAECGLPVVRLQRDETVARADQEPTRPVVSTVAACWLAQPEIVAGLGGEHLEVEAPGGPWTGCWPTELLASDRVIVPGSRCGTCLRVVTSTGVESVPRYSLGLLVERPTEPSGWWWHSRLGQHLPILSGDVVTRLREHVELSAMPVLTDPATAFLPEELR